MSHPSRIEQRVIQSAEKTLSRQRYVRAIDVLMGMGLLQPIHVRDWERGRIPYLEEAIQGSADKIADVMKYFAAWAAHQGLKSSENRYLARTKNPQRELRFTKNDLPSAEKAYQTYYFSPLLSLKQQQQLKEKLEKPPEMVVFWIVSDSECAQCKKELLKGDFLFLDGDQPLCLTCANLSELVFLPAGDAALTRLTKKYSDHSIVVVKFSRARKRYERQGMLVQQNAYEKAQAEVSM